jgi:hypothetical protein
MQTKRFLRGALAAMALVAACEQGPLPLAESSGSMGTVTIRVTAAGAPMAARSLETAASPAVARTVAPEFSSLTFDAYELTFTGERTIVMTVDADKIDAVTLAEGTYTLAVKGRKGGEAIAEGTATAPIIIAGKSSSSPSSSRTRQKASWQVLHLTTPSKTLPSGGKSGRTRCVTGRMYRLFFLWRRGTHPFQILHRVPLFQKFQGLFPAGFFTPSFPAGFTSGFPFGDQAHFFQQFVKGQFLFCHG